MQTSNLYSELIEKAILNTKELRDISTVVGLECLYSSLFTQDHYKQVFECIKSDNIDGLSKLESPTKSKFNEYLEVYGFFDQKDKYYLATIYDSDELSQDPQVIELIDY